ncbi:RusA family crossover junction endodeoxyribonuclease [Methylocystis sp. MJC1]|uniref:RusA family crossover junction endodeoxyribonuclease n=1 Tax=Methylocystis sp. MJC1 TaxID=2654282 RepID=UPI0013E9DC81|nr:RusA family crossover junction endodeoxyribonuclease [Methylocystis sp. MJC1]KAF2989407.1 hypothetical protein MJC1_03557 [Methylocystis sp. MJC1]MBU6526844.1 RusA family crossover junction endodeoxyribonuclease [Methylocystis sp. MJC1]UZX13283.1 RusA family crossover junction endodeoxyribonuclease [Methylocystis sp. MJC1]
MEIHFPLEFIVEGAPVSLQTKRAASKRDWQDRVRAASRIALPPDYFASDDRIAVTLYYFPDSAMDGDIDNIVKPILDALTQQVYLDDGQVERVVVQKFEPDGVFRFAAPSSMLEKALTQTKPLLYVKLSDDPFEELA